MHPNLFLRTFWRMELRPKVFVAIPFSDEHQARYDEVICPAVEKIDVDGVPPLKAYKVDEARSGDCILTEIMEGIAHAQLVLADVSTVGRDSASGRPYRNGNVMYEVGLALACRQPAEVLLIRDDDDPLIFDCSTVPTLPLDFRDRSGAKAKLTRALEDRLGARKLELDARAQTAFRALTHEEIEVLAQIAALEPKRGWGLARTAVATSVWGIPYAVGERSLRVAAVGQLLGKQLIRRGGALQDGRPMYRATDLGRIVAGLTKSDLGSFHEDPPPEGAEGPKADTPATDDRPEEE